MTRGTKSMTIRTHKVSKRFINFVKVMAAWLIIIAMLTEAPLALYAATQQDSLSSGEIMQEGVPLPNVESEAQLESSPVGDLPAVETFIPNPELAAINRAIDALNQSLAEYHHRIIAYNNAMFAINSEIVAVSESLRQSDDAYDRAYYQERLIVLNAEREEAIEQILNLQARISEIETQVAAYTAERNLMPETILESANVAAPLVGVISANSGIVHPITNEAQLLAFLNGTLGANNDIFEISGSITVTGTHQGRGFVGGQPFTGIVRGINNATITGLQLVPRPATAPFTPYQNDIGFIRVLGQGAVIENLTFVNVQYTDAVTIEGWNSVIGNVGLVAGRLEPGSTATINNVTVHGATATANAAITFGGARLITSKTVGGMVGFVSAGSTLNISDATARVAVALNATGSANSIPSAGGFVGETSGSVNVTGTNTVNFATTVGTGGGSRVIQHAGGAIGRITTSPGQGTTTISNLTATGSIVATVMGGAVGSNTNNALGNLSISNSTNSITATATTAGGFVGQTPVVTITGSTNNGAISLGAGGRAGGFVGHGTSNVAGAITLTNVQNHGNITAGLAAGGLVGEGGSITISAAQNHAQIAGTASSIVGGFVGRANGATSVTNSQNNGSFSFTGESDARMVGGIIGNTMAATTIENVTNHANISANRGILGGFVGRSQGAGTLRIVDSTNEGDVFNSSTRNVTGSRTQNSASGGFVADADSTVYIRNSQNYGDVHVHGQLGGGGIIGRTASRAGTNTQLHNVSNHGVVTARHTIRRVGGLIGQSRNAVTITNSANTGLVQLTTTSNGATGSLNSIGGVIGLASGTVSLTNVENTGDVIHTGTTGSAGGTLRMGGLIGVSTNRLSIIDSSNSGNIRAARNANTAGNNMGGIVGRVQLPTAAANRNVLIENVQNHGNVGLTAAGGNADASRAGGIVGMFVTNRAATLNINNVENTGAVQAMGFAGGIVGFGNTPGMNITGAINTGNVTARVDLGAAGGIVGSSDRANLRVRDAGNFGAVRGGIGTGAANNTTISGAGGIVGTIQRGTGNQILTSFNAGSVEGRGQGTGGIVGSIRRSGTTLIQDVYNVGTVHGRRNTPAGVGGQTGNGILGTRRGSVGNVTLTRVFNAGNVTGSPIFNTASTSAGAGSGTGANAINRRMIYNNVFYDTTVHMGRPQQATTGIQGVSTAVLTSGGLAAFAGLNSNWLQNGWIANVVAGNDDAWESYPYLAWQTNMVLQPDFFGEINPGADHLTVVPAPQTATFYSVTGPSVVRDFNPYGTRGTGQGIAAQHQERLTGIHVQTLSPINRAINQRMSVGLISNQGVVGFGANEMFDGVILFGIDEINETLVSWANIYAEDFVGTGFSIRDAVMGLLALERDDVHEGMHFRLTALGYEDTYFLIDFDWIQRIIEAYEAGRRLAIPVPMTRAPIEHLRIEVRNATAETETDPPFIVADRQARVTREGSNLPNVNVVPPLTGNALASSFDASGSFWEDFFVGSAQRFLPEEWYLNHSFIRNPDNPNPSATNPFIIWMLLEDIMLPDTELRIVREEEDDSEYGVAIIELPHGGAVAVNQSNNFTVQWQNTFDVNPTATARTGGGAALNRWDIRNLTTLTEIRVVPVDGQPIGGRTFRPSPWLVMGDIIEWSDAEVPTLLFAQVVLDYETPVNVEVVEAIQIMDGTEHWHHIHIGNSSLVLHAEVGLEYPELRPQIQTPPDSGLFNNVRVMEDELLEANAPGFETAEANAVIERIYNDAEPPVFQGIAPIIIEMERTPVGRLYGFVLHADMLADTELLYVIPNATVVALNSAGQIAAQTTSGSDGFFYIDGLADGVYTVFATHPTYGANLSVPSPVTIEQGTNSRVNIFLDGDEDNGFLLFVNVRNATNENISSIASATLTYAGTTSPRASSYESPFLLMPVHQTNRSWTTGTLDVGATGFAPVSINLADITPPIPSTFDIPFHVITVVLAQPRLTLANFPSSGEQVPAPTNQGVSVGSTVFLANGTFNPLTPITMSVDAEVTLTAGVATGWTFLGWVRGATLPAVGTNIDDFSGTVVETTPYTFDMPGADTRYTAIWGDEDGYVGRPNMATLTIANLPEGVLLTGQTSTGSRAIGSQVTLAHGIPTETVTVSGTEYLLWTFLGWVRGDVLPVLGTNIDDFAGTVYPAGHTATVVAGGVRYTAIWGDEDGYVGRPNNNNLTIGNVPSISLNGQTPSGIHLAGSTVNITAGTPTDVDEQGDPIWEFMGWIRGTTLPSVDDNFADWRAANNTVTVVTNENHSFVMGGTGIRYTAIWGDGEYVGRPNNHNLQIRNVPTGIALSGQTPSGMHLDGATVNITAGTPTELDEYGDPIWEFMGWIRGTTVPSAGDNFATWRANNSSITVITTQNHSFTMGTAVIRYTAVWGDGEYIGRPRNHNLQIHNVPTDISLSGQTPSGIRLAGSTVNIAAGTPTELDENGDPIWEFMGWIRGNNVPSVDDNFADWQTNNPLVTVITTPAHSFTMGAAVIRYTAIWGDGYYVGRPNHNNLVINNLPAFTERPTGQTPSATHNVGDIISLVAGTPTTGDWTFWGWIRYNDALPSVGDNISDFPHAMMAVNVTIGTGVHRYTALWGNEDGDIGIQNSVNVIFRVENELQGTINDTNTITVTVPAGTLLAAHVPTPVAASAAWEFLRWELNGELATPASVYASAGLEFVAIFGQNRALVSTVLIRYFDVDEYNEGNTAPFATRLVTLDTVPGALITYVYTVPTVVDRLGIVLNHVYAPLGVTGDVRYMVGGVLNGWFSIENQTARTITFNNIRGDGSDHIDVFFARNLVPVTVNHVIVDGTNETRTSATVYAREGIVFTPALLTQSEAYNMGITYDFEFVGVAVGGVITDLDVNFAALQIVPEAGQVNEITLIYEVQRFAHDYYHVRHFLYIGGERTLIYTNVIHASDIDHFSIVIPPFVVEPDDENDDDNDNESSNENEVANDYDTANDNENDAYEPVEDNDDANDDAEEPVDANDYAYEVYEHVYDNGDDSYEEVALVPGVDARTIGSIITVAIGFDFDWEAVPYPVALAELYELLSNHPEVVARKNYILAEFSALGITLFDMCNDYILVGGNVLEFRYATAETTATVRHWYYNDGSPLQIGFNVATLSAGVMFAPTARAFEPINGNNLVLQSMDAARMVVADSEHNVFNVFYGSEPPETGNDDSLTIELRVEFREYGTTRVLHSRDLGIFTSLPQVVTLNDLYTVVDVMIAVNEVLVDGQIYTLVGTETSRALVAINHVPDTEFEYTFVFYFRRDRANTHTVSFNLNGGIGVIASQIVNHGSFATQPDSPTRTGYTFLGWFTAPTGGTAFAFTTTPIVANITLHAQWQEVAQGGGSTWFPPPRPRPRVEEEQEIEEIPEITLPDMPLSPYHMAYMIGYQGLVRPGDNMTRAEVATIFFRLMSDQHRVDIWSQSNMFNDVYQLNWYNNAISTLTNGGWLVGYPDGYFRPGQAMTRAEFATLMVRVMGFSDVAGTGAFTDTDGHWAANHIFAAHMLGWVQGFGDGTFRPDQFITRAEVATLINRAIGRLPASPSDLLPGMLVWSDNMDQSAWYYLYIQEATNSNYFEMHEDGIHKTWTGLMANREWWRLERPDSNPYIFTGANIGADIVTR